MGDAVDGNHEPASPAGTKADPDRVRAALAEVLRSAPFRHSRQSQTFLTYIVERTLAGENDLLKERVIGTEVFGRTSDYEPGEDPIVRVRAAEVRKRLAQYYQGPTESSVRIEIPSGSYKATFECRTADEGAPATPASAQAKTFPWKWVALGAVAVAVVIALMVARFTPSASPLDQFWAPALASPKPILISNATMTVYQPDHTSPTREMIPVRGQFTCIGDAYTSLAIGSLFAGKGKLYHIRYGNDVSFSDLRYQPSILIGAFNNAWTMQTTNDLRFIFNAPIAIRDRVTGNQYILKQLAPDGRTPEDYAIVTRIFDSKTGELLISAAGITQYGTRAAGEFLTSPHSMERLAARAPADWRKKNMQVLLHTKVVGDTSGPPDIVTQYFW